MSGKKQVITCDCGDHKTDKDIPSFHNIIKKIDKIFRTREVILISKL